MYRAYSFAQTKTLGVKYEQHRRHQNTHAYMISVT